MAAPLSSSRVLLRRLREIMALTDASEVKLARIVEEIAGVMVAEVSSIYIRRRDHSMELFATKGLNQDAVHKTHMARGEGLVGLVAEKGEPVNLPEARDHPSFSYRPETGEEIYHSFLGVPILSQASTVGVLTVQNQTQRSYAEDEIEALQIIAMVLAELVASGELGAGQDNDVQSSRVLRAVAISSGIAMGQAVFHVPRVVIKKLIADDPDHERERLSGAIEYLRVTIDEMLARSDVAAAGEHREVLEAYRMFANDRGWIRRMREAVATGLTAEAAVARVQSETRARVVRSSNPYMRERANDLNDLSNRLLRTLTGRKTAAEEDLPDGAILVAHTMGPAELLDYDPKKLRGLVLEEGGAASHVAIVARTLGVPAVSQTGAVLNIIEAGDPVIVDADAGVVHIRSSSDVVDTYADKLTLMAQQEARYAKVKDLPAKTQDGVEIDLLMNAGLMVDLPHLNETGAKGIGLFRTEFQFMVSSTLPRLEQQRKMYAKVLDVVGDRPVVFRSLDVGGDKVLPYLRTSHEENPALGWRAIRMALDRPALLRTQIRALLRAANGRAVQFMLPMVADVSEVQAARSLIDKEFTHAEKHGHELPDKLMVGAMIEVPALAWQLDELLPLVDFVSVGSNDLLQFLYAADRSNLHVADRFDALSKPMLRLLGEIVRKADEHEIPVTLCGEMAGSPLGAMALIALGYRSISMAPSSIGPVKAMIRSTDCSEVSVILDQLMKDPDAEIKQGLLDFAEANCIEI